MQDPDVHATPTHSSLRAAALLALLALPLAAAADNPLEVASMSIEDLMKVEVTSVSRKVQRLTDAAAAAYVISADDIQRSGADSIPALLRMVPGVEVARVSSSRWAVSARGSNGRFANKLLVLVDGRSVYSPLFSGVFWESMDLPLEDIERIEVIRGPGAAIWGANAVNGVINILTRHAKRTQGAAGSALVGTEGQRKVWLRWGDALDEDTHVRLSGQAGARDATTATDGTVGSDRYRTQRVGLRLDRQYSATARLSGSLNAFDTRSGDDLLVPSLQAPYVTLTPARQINRGFNGVARLEWTADDGSQSAVQFSLDHYREDMHNVLVEDRTTVDLDFQNRRELSPTQEVVWGFGLRQSQDDTVSGQSLMTLTPASQRLRLLSAFVHDEITLVPDQWRLMVGSKFEHNSYTGFEVQPNVRSLWNLNPTDAVWAGLSRAVRTPARVERGIAIDLLTSPPDLTRGQPLPLVVQSISDSSFGSESVVSLEAGYRTQLRSDLMLDLALFHNRYRHLRSGSYMGTSLQQRDGVPYLLYSMLTDNSMSATGHGLELALDWRARADWRVQTAYTYFDLRSEVIGLANQVDGPSTVTSSSPRHQLSVRSRHDLNEQHQVDLWVRRVGALGSPAIPAYTALDLRWGWRVSPQLQWSVVGQNLLKAEHLEFSGEPLPSVQMRIPRTLAVKATWQL